MGYSFWFNFVTKGPKSAWTTHWEGKQAVENGARTIEGWSRELRDAANQMQETRYFLDKLEEPQRTKLLNGTMSEEELRQLRGTSSEEPVIKGINFVRNPSKVLDIITAPFEDKDVKFFCETCKDPLYEPEHFTGGRYRSAFSNGINRFSDFDQNILHKNFATELTTFMATNEIFQVLLDAHEHACKALGQRSNAAYGLANLIVNTPATERDNVLEIMDDNPVLRTAVNNTKGHSFIIKEVTPDTIHDVIKERDELLEATEKYPFFKPALEMIDFPDDYIQHLARGLSPEEFDEMLTHTRLLARTEIFEGVTLETFRPTINDIAVEALMYSEPELLKETNAKPVGRYPDIKAVCDDRETAYRYRARATKILKIALSHCKQPEQPLSPDLILS